MSVLEEARTTSRASWTACEARRSVEDAHEVQPLRRSRGPGLAAVLLLEEPGDARARALAAPDLDQRPGQRAHHVVEEAVALDHQREGVAARHEVQGPDVALVRLARRAG